MPKYRVITRERLWMRVTYTNVEADDVLARFMPSRTTRRRSPSTLLVSSLGRASVTLTTSAMNL